MEGPCSQRHQVTEAEPYTPQQGSWASCLGVLGQAHWFVTAGPCVWVLHINVTRCQVFHVHVAGTECSKSRWWGLGILCQVSGVKLSTSRWQGQLSWGTRSVNQGALHQGGRGWALCLKAAVAGCSMSRQLWARFSVSRQWGWLHLVSSAGAGCSASRQQSQSFGGSDSGMLGNGVRSVQQEHWVAAAWLYPPLCGLMALGHSCSPQPPPPEKPADPPK